MQLRCNQLDFPAGQFRIGFLALENFAFHGDDEFAARLLGFGVRRGLRLLVENHLHDASAVAHIKKKQIAKVAAPRYPAHDNGIAAFVLGAQFAAVVCALQVAKKIQHVSSPCSSGLQARGSLLSLCCKISREKASPLKG